MPWRAPSLEDLIGIEHSKLGFFQELRQTIEALKDANAQSAQRRREIAAILDGITDIMDETCGKCTPCRIGSKRLFETLDKITKGHASSPVNRAAAYAPWARG